MANTRIEFFRSITGTTEDHELMSNWELQDMIKDYYGVRVFGNSNMSEFTIYCTEEIIIDTLSFCCRYGNFSIKALDCPKYRI